MMKVFVLREEKHLNAMLAFVAENWRTMAATKSPMQVLCKPETRNRNIKQNRYYWQALHQIQEQAWVEGHNYHAEVWHEFAKRKFLGIVELPGGGSTSASTRSLSTTEFADYVRSVEAWAAQELGVSFVDCKWGM